MIAYCGLNILQLLGAENNGFEVWGLMNMLCKFPCKDLNPM
jgi:hypothetical protein